MSTKEDLGGQVAESATGLLLFNPPGGIVVINPTTNERISVAGKGMGSPVWSPRGDRVAFLDNEEGDEPSHVWTVPVDRVTGKPTGAPQRVSLSTVLYRGVHNISFSPDGRFVVAAVKGGKLIAIPSTGGVERTVVQEKFEVREPQWGADNRIYYGEVNAREGNWIRVIPANATAAMHSRRLLHAGPIQGVSHDGKFIAYYDGTMPYNNGHIPLRIATTTGVILKSTTMPVIAYDGFWSGRDDRFFFASWDVPSGIHAIDFGANAVRTITAAVTHDRLPAYSADGQRIAVQRLVNGTYQIAVMNADGSGSRLYPATAGVTNFDLHWSPDGKYIAFTSSAPQHAILDVQTGKVVRTVQDTTVNRNVRWRDDSKALRYVSFRNGPPTHDVREVTIDGADRELLHVTTQSSSVRLLGGDSILTVSPTTVEVVPIAGGKTRTISRLAITKDASASPDRKWMATIVNHAQSQSIRLVSLMDKSTRDIPQEFSCGLGSISWHPDGRNLITSTWQCGSDRSDFILVPLDGGPPTNLTSADKDATDVTGPSISPDGRRLIYGAEAQGTFRVGVLDFTRLAPATSKGK